MDEFFLELKQDLVEVFRKYGIKISEDSLELKTKPYYRQYNNLVDALYDMIVKLKEEGVI